jgi:hypothetical protein
MFRKLAIGEEEKVYRLDSIGLENTELVITESNKYILTEDAYFPFMSIQDFHYEESNAIIHNSENDKLLLTSEQIEAILKIFEKN